MIRGDGDYDFAERGREKRQERAGSVARKLAVLPPVVVAGETNPASENEEMRAALVKSAPTTREMRRCGWRIVAGAILVRNLSAEKLKIWQEERKGAYKKEERWHPNSQAQPPRSGDRGDQSPVCPLKRGEQRSIIR